MGFSIITIETEVLYHCQPNSWKRGNPQVKEAAAGSKKSRQPSRAAARGRPSIWSLLFDRVHAIASFRLRGLDLEAVLLGGGREDSAPEASPSAWLTAEIVLVCPAGEFDRAQERVQRVERAHVGFLGSHDVVGSSVSKLRLRPPHVLQQFALDLLAGFCRSGPRAFHTKIGNPLYAGRARKQAT